jgi:hypothetical protein
MLLPIGAGLLLKSFPRDGDADGSTDPGDGYSARSRGHAGARASGHAVRIAVDVIGAAIGVGGALAMAKVISGFLHGITATDTATFISVLVPFAGVAIVSTHLPARRVTAIDRTVAFRAE